MTRGDHQDDDDDFMELPQQNRATGRTKDGDEINFHMTYVLNVTF